MAFQQSSSASNAAANGSSQLEAGNTDELTSLLNPAVPSAQQQAQQRRSAFKSGASAVLAAAAVAAVLTLAAIYIPQLVELHPPELSKAVTYDRLRGHLQAFSDVAAKSKGNSRSVTNGYNASVDYIVAQLKEHTDYSVTVQPFKFPYFENVSPPTLYIEGLPALKPEVDFDTLGNSGSATILNASIQTVRSGCLVSDYPSSSFRPGSIALLTQQVAPGSPKGCTYRTKISAALQAGASGVLLYTALPSSGPVLGRCNPDVFPAKFPVLGVTHSIALGLLEKLAVGAKPIKVSLSTDVRYRDVPTLNVIADTPHGNPNDTIVAGSHLDSVTLGPGINDDGSGSAATLEVALSLYRTGLSRRLVNRVRFAWWSAEELGLLGSNHYVDDLGKNNPEELKKIALNLNNDMIASPNGVRFIYNGKDAEDPKLRPASGKIQRIFQAYFNSLNMTHDPTPFDGRSDYGGFLRHGIPAGGLFTGAEGVKTEDQAKRFGGVPGMAYDPCYHRPCDTLDNIEGTGLRLLSELAGAMGHIVQLLSSQPNLRDFLVQP